MVSGGKRNKSNQKLRNGEEFQQNEGRTKMVPRVTAHICAPPNQGPRVTFLDPAPVASSSLQKRPHTFKVGSQAS